MNENEKELMNELENQKRLRQPPGYGRFVGLRTNMVVYDDYMGQMYPHLGMPDAIKELINNEYGLAIEREGFEMNSKETEMRLNGMRKVIQKDTNDESRRPASDGFREWINESQKGLCQGIRDAETGLHQQKNYGHGKDHDAYAAYGYAAYANAQHTEETKKLVNALYGLPDSTAVEHIRELEEQVKILKDVLGLTKSELTAKLLERSVTPNQIRSIMGINKIDTSRAATIEDVLERAKVTWYDDVVQDCRVVVSRNADQPITSDEREMMYKMWVAQNGHIHCVFYEQARPNDEKKLVDEFPKIGGHHFEPQK